MLGGAIETGQSICDAVALTQVAATSGIAVDTAKATGKTNSGSDTPRCTYTVGTALDKGSVVIDFTPGIGTLESVKRLSPGGKETTTAKFPSYSVTRERLHDQALFVQTAQGVLLVQINPGKSVALAGLDTKVSKLAEQVISSQANK